ncbi:DUF5801 repeats-in-toxin domain-containing protein, partial [Novosphingobium mangrovi (ex Huang et al. 2023)]
MAINITFDGTLRLDQTEGLQDDDVALGITTNADGGTDDNDDDILVGGLDQDFLDFLNGLNDGTFLSDDLLAFAALVDGASDSDFVTIEATSEETITDVFLSDASGNAFDGDQVFISAGVPLQTVGGDNIFLWSAMGGKVVLATTSAASAISGQLVAAFFIEPDFSGGDPYSITAKMEMVTFMPFDHPLATNPDDSIDFSDILNVSVAANLSFDFDNLDSGNFLWAAVGSDSAGLLITGQDLNVNQDDTSSKYGKIITGGSDPSDTVNTSQGGINATIGILSQHFTDAKEKGTAVDGPVGVFTLVRGLDPLAASTDGQATGINIQDIDYDSYINAPSASIFISQTDGGGTAMFEVALWEAGGGTTPEESFDYIGNTDTDSALHDDGAVAVDHVEITRGSTTYVWDNDIVSGTGSSGSTQGGITVTFDTNAFVVAGATTGDTIEFAAEDGSTFNRFTVQGLANTSSFDIGRVDIDEGIIVPEPVGDYLLVDDDGPDAKVINGTPDTLTLDETRPEGSETDGNSSPAGLASTTANFADNFTDGGNPVDYGTDGAGSVGYSLVLTGSNVGSGLYTLGVGGAMGNEIVLNQSGNTVTGSYGGTTYFTISINQTTGVVTFAQSNNIWHGSTASDDDSEGLTLANAADLKVVQTVTDADGDQ